MNKSRNILKAFLLLAVVATLALGSIATAGATGPNYTDGTEVFLDENGNDWGPPPEAPHFEELAEGAPELLCIDPPGEVWMTIHAEVDGVEYDSDTFLYYPAPEGTEIIIHEAMHACRVTEQPVCPPEGPVGLTTYTFTWHATWDLGSGEGEALTQTLECEILPPPPPPVVPPVEVVPPVTPPAVPVEGVTPTPEGQLPVTGSMTAPLVGIASVLAGIGYSLHRFTKAARTKIAG